MSFFIEFTVNDRQARAALDAIFETLDRVAGWPVDATEVDRWADDGGSAPMSGRRRRQDPGVDGDELLLDLLETSRVARRDAALLLWHRLYGWPALRAMGREWSPLQVVR